MNTKELNQAYQQHITEIANALYVIHKVNREANAFQNESTEPNWEDPIGEALDREKYAEKAEKLYKFFESKEEVMKVINFLRTLHPQFPQGLIEAL